MVRLQGEAWGWLREHSLKGLVCHIWPGGSQGKSLKLPKRQETFSCLPVSWCARRGDSERRLKELQTGTSRSYQRGPQRQARDAKAAAAATKKAVCKHRSPSTPPLLGACAARHCQGPVIQGQLPRENAWRLRLLQRHAGLCRRRLAPHPYPSLHPA